MSIVLLAALIVGQSVQEVMRDYQEAANEAVRRENRLSQTAEGRATLASEHQAIVAQRQLQLEAQMTPYEKRMARYAKNRAAAKAAQKVKDDARAAAKAKLKTTSAGRAGSAR